MSNDITSEFLRLRDQKHENHLRHSAVIGSLRGLAILFVMMVHTGACFQDLSWTLMKITEQGARGVQLFFILSALTLLMSWHKRDEPNAAKRFLVRRFFRIAPMFYLAIIGYALADGFTPRYFAPKGVGLFEYAATALFINAWIPNAINSIVPGEWSVAVEFFFYLLFPILVMAITNFKKALIAFFATVGVGALISYALKQFLSAPDHESARLVRDFIFLWPGIQLPVFFVGFALYYIIQNINLNTPPELQTNRTRAGNGLVIASICLIVVLSLVHIPIINHLLFAVVFAFFIFGLTIAPTKIIINRLMDNLGTLSYSAYFLHFVVIRISESVILHFIPTGDTGFAIFFLYVIAVTFLLSSVTYRYIEKPGIGIGRRLALKI